MDELADLAAGGDDHLEQLGFGLARLAIEEFEHADGFLLQTNRNAQARPQAIPLGVWRPRKVVIAKQIRNPGGLTALPDPAWQTGPRAEVTPGAVELQLRHAELDVIRQLLLQRRTLAERSTVQSRPISQRVLSQMAAMTLGATSSSLEPSDRALVTEYWTARRRSASLRSSVRRCTSSWTRAVRPVTTSSKAPSSPVQTSPLAGTIQAWNDRDAASSLEAKLTTQRRPARSKTVRHMSCGILDVVALGDPPGRSTSRTGEEHRRHRA